MADNVIRLDDHRPPPKPRRAKDFVKCTDPNCERNAWWERWHPGEPHPPHCHPVFE